MRNILEVHFARSPSPPRVQGSKVEREARIHGGAEPSRHGTLRRSGAETLTSLSLSTPSPKNDLTKP